MITDDAWVLNLRKTTSKKEKMFRFFKSKVRSKMNEILVDSLNTKVDRLESRIDAHEKRIKDLQLTLEVEKTVTKNQLRHQLIDTYLRDTNEKTKDGYVLFRTFNEGRQELWINKEDLVSSNA